MINEPTLLILGAGASMPYKFPSGAELLKNVCTNLASSDSNSFSTMINLGFSTKLVNDFRGALLYSGAASVDTFLEHREEFLEIGKAAIAQALIPYELDQRMIEENDQHWYKYLFNKLNAPFKKFGENKLSIVTYNYDRSLEFFLFNYLRNFYGQPEEECVKTLNKIPIIHLHGNLGNLPWQGGDSRPYNGHANVAAVQLASKNIKIIHEKNVQDKEFERAHISIYNASKILFLGFGYNKTNLDRLQLDSFLKTGSKVQGTAFKLTDLERKSINNFSSGKKIILDNVGYHVLDFLRNRVQLD